MNLRFASASATLLAVALAGACSGSAVHDPGASSGSSASSASSGSPGCEPVTCDLFCENGFAKGEDGCEICSCNPSACEGQDPSGCVVNGCPTDSVCDTSQGCAPSSCECDSATGSWVCTEDCGGGICVPAGGACSGPDPSGCKSKGCPAGQICDSGLGCFPSGCACDEQTGTWGCLADCGGGVCVPDPTGCSEPSPAGCIKTGCPIDETCMPTSGVCVPSWCTCDAQTGTWGCTDDCGGGICVK